jgi:hypothetical protein
MAVVPHDVDLPVLGDHFCSDADQTCGASYGAVSPDRTKRRPATGTATLASVPAPSLSPPKLRPGSYFMEWLHDRRLVFIRAKVRSTPRHPRTSGMFHVKHAPVARSRDRESPPSR